MYQNAMTLCQLEFYRSLFAPFASDELSETPSRGNKPAFVYIDKRTIENRLDSVCGPGGWSAEYREIARGLVCRLSIRVPQTDGTWVFLSKEDGAGPEDMGSRNKTTNEWEPDLDNDIKSNFTNAFRRAAQDAWGIGRYLYRKGIPTFLDPDAKPFSQQGPRIAEAPTSGPLTSGNGKTSEPPQDLRDKEPKSVIDGKPLSSKPQPAPRNTDEIATIPFPNSNFRIPPPGRAVFAWAKEMEKTFETKFVDGMGQKGEERGYGRVFADWTAEQVADVVTDVIDFIKKLKTYKGQYDHIYTKSEGVGTVTQPVAPKKGINLGELRRELINNVAALIEYQTNEKPDNAHLFQAIQTISSECINESGHNGEILDSLSGCADVTWLRNMIEFTKDQVVHAMKEGQQGESDIPF